MKVDLIVAVWNQLDVTKGFLESLSANTDLPYRLIIIDNGSDKYTRDFLDGFAQDSKSEVKMIHNSQNLGFTKAINQGFKISDGDFVCVLNNDIILSYGWLSEMINIARKDDRIGVVNPSSNNLGDRLLGGESIKDHAAILLRDKGRYGILDSCIGFCMLIKRSVMEKIGFFDEIYNPANFEDTDYCRRAQKEGFLCVVARGAYVYHLERTSQKRRRDTESIFKRNQHIFYQRWGKPQRVLYLIWSRDFSKIKFKEMILKLIRPGVLVSVYSDIDMSHLLNNDGSFNIKTFKFKKEYFNFKLLGKIVFKKKKFYRIFVFDRSYYNLLKLLSIFHKAEVVFGNG